MNQQPAPTGDDTEPRAPRRWRSDLLMAVLSLGLSLFVTSGLWADPNGRASGVNSGDQALFEWLLGYGAYAVTHGVDPLFTYLLNVPDGVNLAVNTSITVYAVLFAPVTIAFGPHISFLVILTLNLAGSAFAWYWLMHRHLGASAYGAIIGGLFCGFAPAMISHANAHLNWTAQWLIPLIIARVLLFARRHRPVRDGLILGLLIAACFSIAAEALFFTALALGVFTAAWVIARWSQAKALARRFLIGLAVAAAVAGVLLSYPLYLHFFGAQGYHGTGFDPRVHNEDLAAYAVWPERSLAGALGLNTHLAANPTEENSFFGAPLLGLVLLGAVGLWRAYGRLSLNASNGTALNASDGTALDGPAERATLRALLITGGVFALLSLGPELRWLGRLTGIPMPEALLGSLPIFNAALPSRLALVVAPVLGIVLAWMATGLSRNGSVNGSGVRRSGVERSGFELSDVKLSGGQLSSGQLSGVKLAGPRWAWVLGFAIALVPLLPTPLLERDREPVPHFITSGAWQRYVGDGETLMPAPLPNDLLPDGQRWQAAALAQAAGDGGPVFRLPAGFFLGPGGPDDTGRIGPIPRPTQTLLEHVAKTGVVPVITERERLDILADLRYWQAKVVVLADTVHGAHWDTHQPAVLAAMTQLLGQPERVDDVWLWRTPPA